MPKKKITESVTSSDPQTKRWKQLFAAGRMAYEVGELRQAESLLARALELAHNLPERSFAEQSTEIGSAAILLAQRRTKEAEKRLKKCIGSLEGSSDDMHKELLAVALRFHAQALVDNGDERSAEKDLQRSAEILKNLGSDASVQRAYTLSDMCGLLLKQGRQSEAEHLILRAMKILSDVLGPEHADYTRADMIYALCLPMDQTARMDSVADGIRRMEYMYGSKHPNITRALDRYIDLLKQRGDTAKIEEVKSMFNIKSPIGSDR